MKISNYVVILIFACLGLPPVLSCESTSKDWKSIDLKNDLITVQVVPEIGGRIIQFKLGDYGFFWVNEKLAGMEPPAGGVGPDGKWLNYGGDKLWPAPQGWDNDQQWPGPPDAVLDGGPYTAQLITEKERPVAVQLTSREDKRSGIQFSRVIKISDGTTHVSIDATMKNIDTKHRRWGIWAVTQLNAANRHADGYNENYWAYCPINHNSIFHKGYSVLFGLVNNTSFKPDYQNQMMRVHYQRKVGKIGLDSHAGWVATVDAADGYVFVQRFIHEPDKVYPDDSSVEFWTNGLGEFIAWGKINKMPENQDGPYILESEILSPYAALNPGESYTFHYDWFAARIPSSSPAIACSDIAVTCKPFTVEPQGGRIYLKGHFGVFYEGYITPVFIDGNNKEVEAARFVIPVSPLKALDLSATPGLTDGVEIPDKSQKVAIYMYDAKERFIGELARARILKD